MVLWCGKFYRLPPEKENTVDSDSMEHYHIFQCTSQLYILSLKADNVHMYSFVVYKLSSKSLAFCSKIVQWRHYRINQVIIQNAIPYLQHKVILLCKSKNREHFDSSFVFPIVQQPIRSDMKPETNYSCTVTVSGLVFSHVIVFLLETITFRKYF